MEGWALMEANFHSRADADAGMLAETFASSVIPLPYEACMVTPIRSTPHHQQPPPLGHCADPKQIDLVLIHTLCLAALLHFSIMLKSVDESARIDSLVDGSS